MQRLTKKDLCLSLHASGRTVEEIARALETHPSYVANVLAAEEGVKAEGEGGMSTYPEHEKLQAIKEKSQACGEFLDWLKDVKGYSIMEYLPAWTDGKPLFLTKDGKPTSNLDYAHRVNGSSVPNPEHDYRPEGFYHPRKSGTLDLLYEFFEIDPEKLDDEKRAMLDALRANQ